MKILFDTHTHTLASTHAYSTVMENAKYASEIGMEAIAVTDHAPANGSITCVSPETTMSPASM
ncbi:MAG: PHP domain-containing protein, partial [Clostridia bacterium]|nr:PHP domain-containing protein [Clostridia bacterium]